MTLLGICNLDRAEIWMKGQRGERHREGERESGGEGRRRRQGEESALFEEGSC